MPELYNVGVRASVAAIALVHAHNVEAAMESLLRDAANVVSVAGTLKAMNDDDDEHVLGLPGLPMAMSEQTGLRVNLKKPSLGRRNIEPPGHESRDDSHCVAVLQ